MFCGLRFYEACYGRACLGDFRFGNFPALFDGFFDTVVEMIVDEQQRYRFNALFTADICVRMSMQYSPFPSFGVCLALALQCG